MNVAGHDFRQVWAVDFEFTAPDGERPSPVCVVARELGTDQLVRVWLDRVKPPRRPPYPIDEESLFVAYYASADIGCHLALGWDVPTRVLDLFAEFRVRTNGLPTESGSGLLGAAVHFGLDTVGLEEKTEMRDLAMRGGPYSHVERAALLDYCQSDVDTLVRLFPRMMGGLDLPRALLRGRFMAAAARIERTGVPMDVDSLTALKDRWTSIQGQLIERIDVDYQVFEGRTFKADRWADWLAKNDIPWPRLSSGRLALDDDTFREMARSHREVAPMRELRVTLAKMRLSELAVGRDGRNRCLLSAFRSKTGRNQPSNSKSIFGPSTWMRGLIRPERGHGIAYVDWAQQEFGIAAALSGDDRMWEAYDSGDPYLAFARQAGAVPADATKATHGSVREQYKACVLAVNYGMGDESLAQRIQQPVVSARRLLEMHRQTYARFWRWSQGAVDHAMLKGSLQTVFGWAVHTGTSANRRSLANFPMQANGAEMLRLACIFATEEGIRVCVPVHDALLIEAPLEQLDHQVELTCEMMARASEITLDGFRLRSDAKVVRYPDRYMDERGEIMWKTIQRILAGLSVDREPPGGGDPTGPLVGHYPPMGEHPPHLMSYESLSYEDSSGRH